VDDMSIKSRAIAAAVAAVTFSAVPVWAQDGAPQPGCLGIAVTDPAGDASRLTGEGPASADITGLFFTFEDGKHYANLQLADAQDELAPGATGARWYIFFKVGNGINWVRATKTGPVASTFNYGHVDPADESRVSDGTTEGKFFTGPNGVIQILIPAEAGGKTGTASGGPYAETNEAVGNQLLPIDETKPGKAFTMGTCPGAAATPTQAPVGTAPPAPPAEVVALQVAAPKSAKAKGKALKLAVRSNGEITNIRAALKKGSGTVGTGSLAKLKGKGTLALKLKRKLKKGSYSLVLSGNNPDGKPASLTTALKLK
jgi:hypothetical protein